MVAAASMQELAEAMSLKPTAVYHYFASKDELLAEVVTKAHTEAWQTVSRALAAAGDSLHALTAFVESLTKWASGRRNDCLSDLVRRGQTDGRVKHDVDPELASAAIIGAIAAVTSPARAVRGRDGRVLPSLVLAGLTV